jgi:hypothetical protein
MSRSDFTRVFVILVAALSVATVARAQDRTEDGPMRPVDKASSLNTGWMVETIRGGIPAFSHVSVARDDFYDLTFIVYYDALNGNLEWARTVSSGGNCGPGHTWLCEELVTGGDVGLYNSIALYNTPGGVDLIIPFFDATNERLMYVDATVFVADDSLVMDTHVVDVGFNDPEDRTGVYTAVRYDDNHEPWIAYQNETYGSLVGTHFMMAEWAGDGSGNCGFGGVAGDWNCYDLFSNGLAQTFGSTGLTIDTVNRPVVAYYAPNSGDAVVARRVGSGSGDCGPGSDWQCFSVRGRLLHVDTGKHVVPFTDDGWLSLFYQNVTTGSLERATYLGAVPASNCGLDSTGLGAGQEWLCETIDSMDGDSIKRGISVAGDESGFPVVAYQFSADPGPALLRVARPTASPGVSSAGNCGPGDAWFCDTVDGDPDRSEADSVSLVFGSEGAGFLAYHEWDGYNFFHNLKLATFKEEIFSDGFEAGNTSAWSTAVP